MDGDGPKVRHENIGSIVGFVLGEKAATIKEFREDYDVEDLLNMWEVLMVKEGNKYWAHKEASKPQNNGGN